MSRSSWSLARAISILIGISLATAVISGQPISFNHQKHVSDVGLACTDCHLYVNSQPFAGLPGLDVCLTCHEEPQTDSPEEEKLRTLQSNGGQLQWKALYRVPNHVYFSHRRHVTAGKLECSTCHGNVADLKKPPVKQTIPISMNRCIACHQRHDVNDDCLSCHR